MEKYLICIISAADGIFWSMMLSIILGVNFSAITGVFITLFVMVVLTLLQAAKY